MKAIAKYPGSKWSIADWIVGFLPPHHSYLEPYFGSGAVLFNKPRSDIETINDLDNAVVDSFRCIRDDPERLARAIYYTPYARDIYNKAYSEQPQDRFEHALNFYIRLQMGRGFRTNGEKVGWKEDVQGREKSYASQDWRSLPDKILQAAERLRGVQIENRSALDLIERFNYKDALIYCDPPYMLETRYGKQYRVEMSDADHEELMDVITKHKGKILISGYDTPLYRDRLRGWRCYETTARTQVCTKKREFLWMNYDPPDRQMEIEDYEDLLASREG